MQDYSPLSLLRERATDWIGQLWHERLIQCANTLYVHRYLDREAHDRITNRIAADLNREVRNG